MLLESLYTNDRAATQGRWVTIREGFKMLMRSLSTAESKNALARIRKENPLWSEEEIHNELLVTHLARDWDGPTTADGEEDPFTPEKLKTLLARADYIRIEAMFQATNSDNFIGEISEDELGN